MNRRKLEALFDHAARGRYNEVQTLLKEGVDPNGKDRGCKTAVMIAARWLHKEVVELLLNSGADVHCSDNRGWTVLHHSAFMGRELIVQSILDKGPALNVKNNDGKTPMMLAAQMGYSKVVELLLRSGASIHCCDGDGWTALHHATDNASVEGVQCLLNRGAAVDIKNSDGETPLMLAAKGCHKEVFELLIRSGADIHCCDRVAGWSLLHQAAYRGSVEIAESLVYRDVDLNVKSCKDETPLMLAARLAKREVAELLIDSGADIRCRDAYEMSVLHCAVSGGCLAIVQLLHEKGADINARGTNWKSPLRVAFKREEETDISEFLLKAGADCNSEDLLKNESPFGYLVRKRRSNISLIKLCIEKGAYVKPNDYNIMLEDPTLKKVILQDVQLCSQALLNKFNNRDLPILCRRLASAKKLPPIDKMKIRDGSGMALEVEQAVAHEIKSKGFCDLIEMPLPVLRMLCVKSAVESFRPAYITYRPPGFDPYKSLRNQKKV